MRKAAPIEQAFWSRVDQRGPNECWPWRGTKNHKNYGRFRGAPAQRVAWELVNGPFPAGKLACHSCDHPLCVNPAHVWPGTPKDNSRDRDRKGRGNTRAATLASQRWWQQGNRRRAPADRPRTFLESAGTIHLAHGQSTLCGLSERDCGPTPRRVATCAACAAIIETCRGVRTNVKKSA